MIKSMTGYGKASVSISGRNISVELKTLNSKQLDLNLKIPGIFKERELEIRNMLTQRLERGKTELFVSVETTGESDAMAINHGLARRYYTEIKALATELGIETPGDLLSFIVRMPDVIESRRDELSDEEFQPFFACLTQVITQADQFRSEEGKILESDMLLRVQSIVQMLDEIVPLENQRVVAVRERMMRDFAKYSETSSAPPPDMNRFEQELIYYFEKLDITEEKVRLLKHCEYFLETLNEQGAQGKKLGFIAQEMGREINTIGSKANDADIQRIVVRMKDELEKIKEQLGNIL